MSMYFVFIRIAEFCAKLTWVFLFHFLKYAHLLPYSLPLFHWWMRKDWKGETPRVPFSVIIFRINGWLTQGSIIYVKKGMISFLSCFCLCECTWLLYFKEVLGQKMRIASQAVSASIYSLVDQTRLSCTCSKSPWTWLCAHGAASVLHTRGVARNSGRHALCMSPLLTCMFHCHIGLHLQNTSPKIKLWRISS